MKKINMIVLIIFFSITKLFALEPFQLFNVVPTLSDNIGNRIDANFLNDSTTLKSYLLLEANQENLNMIVNAHPNKLSVIIPITATHSVIAELQQNRLYNQNLRIRTQSGNKVTLPKFVAYYGKILGKEKSYISIIFFPDRISCVISDVLGNLTIGKINEFNSPSELYVSYRSSDLNVLNPFKCQISNDSLKAHNKFYDKKDDVQFQTGTGECKVLAIYFELTREICVDFFNGNTQQTLEYLFTLFNGVSALYRNESILMEISEIYLWDTGNDPYSNTNIEDGLDEFEDNRFDFYGNLAHLLTTHFTGSGMGGIAESSATHCFNDLCDGWFAYSDVFLAFTGWHSNLPLYAWDINVVAHEMGHNLGSRHTHSCFWSGGAIDGCYDSETAYVCPFTWISCNDGPMPGSEGGTIMSYCHNQSCGINFANGFGPQPGDAIRQFIEDDQQCLWTRSNNCYVQNEQFLSLPFEQVEYAYHTLFVGKNVTATIPIGDVSVTNNNGITTSFVAGREVVFRDGFNTVNANNFRAYIDPNLLNCDNNYSMKSNTPILTENNDLDKSMLNLDKDSKTQKLYIKPNPLFDNAKIEIRITQNSIINLALYDLLGNKILEFANNEVANSTQKEYILNSTNIPSGIYTIILQSDNDVVSERIAIIK